MFVAHPYDPRKTPIFGPKIMGILGILDPWDPTWIFINSVYILIDIIMLVLLGQKLWPGPDMVRRTPCPALGGDGGP